MTLLDRRMVVVVGKGGVGRTTCAVALGLAAARHGKRVLLAELGGTDHLARAVGVPPCGYTPTTVADGVDVMSLTPMDCLEDFGRRKLQLNRLVTLVLRSRVVQAFVDAVPGLHDLLQLGKLENLLNEPTALDPQYDLCILDAPATGHGLTLLAAARSMREMTRVGPFAELARIIEDFLHGPRCSVAAVTLLEPLPVQETGELLESLRATGIAVDAVIANRVDADVLPATPAWQTLRARVADALSPAVLALADAADAAHHQREEAERALRDAAGTAPTWSLPEADASPTKALADVLAPLLEVE